MKPRKENLCQKCNAGYANDVFHGMGSFPVLLCEECSMYYWDYEKKERIKNYRNLMENAAKKMGTRWQENQTENQSGDHKKQ